MTDLSPELQAGIISWREKFSRLEGTEQSVLMPDGQVRTGILQSSGDCQPFILTAEGRRFRVSPQEWDRLVRGNGR